MTERDLLDLALEACEAAKRAGADFVEVSARAGRSTSVRVERSAIDSVEVSRGEGASVRAFANGGLGAVSVDGLDRGRLMECARQAAEMARYAVPDRDFVTLPAPEPPVEVEGLYDPAVEALDVPALAKMASECVESARSIAAGATCTGAVSSWAGRGAVANSLGVARSSRGTSISAWIEPIVRRGDDVGAFYDFDAARRLADFDHRGIGAEAARTALRFLGAVKVETGEMPVVLGPLAASSLFETLAAQAGAEAHQRGRSWLCGMLGKRIASPLLTLRDDATVPAGLSSRSHDSEGVPSRPVTVVEEGVLVSLLHNSYTANKAGAAYTGHAAGGGIAPTNVNPALGSVSSEEIIRSVRRGLYINMGGIAPDGATGDVSATVDFGFLIENGEITRPVAGTMVAAGGRELLEGIEAVSSDARVEPGSVMPTVLVRSMRVAGGK